MITRECDYALRTVLCLAQAVPEQLMSTAQLAERMGIPYRFLRRIVARLADVGLVTTQRGNGGGLVLARSPKQISLLDVIHAVDSKNVMLNACLGENHACEWQNGCPVHRRLSGIQRQLDAELAQTSFADLLDGATAPAYSRPG